MVNKKVNKTDSKILIADDHPANVMLLDKILKINGFSETLSITDSRDIMKAFNKFQPDLLLLDLKMPYLDGFDILRSLNEEMNTSYLPVIVISAQDDMTNRLKALEMGAQDFISKPFNNSEVMLRVSNFLDLQFYNNNIKNKNIILEKSIQKKNDELNRMQDEVMNRLLRAIEFRDHETGDHINRISEYTTIIAKGLGLLEENIDKLTYASLMHDIGKIGVPDEVLNKPGTLNNSEWEQMKTHTVKGAEILENSGSKVIQLAEQIALTHHEKWDGTGYPEGLSGTNIPLSGRIVAIVDVFDALMSERPYKKAWKFEAAVNYLQEQSGKHFDPDVVKAFFENLPEIKKVLSAHNNEIKF
jgi:putative two-component system response regulator